MTDRDRILRASILCRGFVHYRKFLQLREDLVYDAQTGDLIGFTNMGSRSNNKVDDLATHALTVYAKSFYGTPGLKFPLAYFATATAKAPQLLLLFGKASDYWKLMASWYVRNMVLLRCVPKYT